MHLDYSDSSQTSNTVYLTNTPPKFTSTSVSSNNTSITIVFSEEVTADAMVKHRFLIQTLL
jgi:hypothetical protein